MMARLQRRTRTIVIALGGNALQPAGGKGDVYEQFAHTRSSLEPLVALAREGWRIVVVRGNGPQIGDDLRRNELASPTLPPLPVGVQVAGTEGWIGYMIQQSLKNALDRFGVRRDVVTVVTQVVVDPEDPLTPDPVKTNGRAMDEDAARSAVAAAERTTGLVTDDVVRFGPARVLDAVMAELAS
jgi:carbamate kinase